MKAVSISGSPRANVGKKDAQELRREGKIPCVLYGGKDQVHFSVVEKEFRKVLYSPDVFLVKLDISGRTAEAVLKEIQVHRVTDAIIHIDFQEVIAGKPTEVSLPVKLIGTAAGVRSGGKLNKKVRALRVRGTADKIPDAISINVEKMEIGDSVRVSDMKIDGLTFLDVPSQTIVAVQVTRNVVEEEKPAAAAAAPAAGAAAPAAGAAAPAKEGDKKPEAKK